MTTHDKVRNTFKKHFGSIDWNENSGSFSLADGKSRRLKKRIDWSKKENERCDVSLFLDDLFLQDIDIDQVTVKLSRAYITILYPEAWLNA